MTNARPKLLRADAVAEAGMTETPAQSFYAPALSGDERSVFECARRERGLDEEIALLRLQVYKLLKESESCTDPSKVQLTMRAIDLIVKALRAHGARIDADQSTLEQELERAAFAVQQRAGEQ